MERIDFLKGVDVFSRLKPGQLGLLSSILQEKECAEDEIIFRENDPGDKLYIVQSGVVEIKKTVPLKDGKEGLRLARFGKGEVFGEMGFFDNRPRSAAAQAYVKTKILLIEKARLEELFHKDPILEILILREILRKVSERLRGADEAIRDLSRNLLWF